MANTPTPEGPKPQRAMPPERGQGMRPGDQALPGTPGTGEAVCPHCGGSGMISGKPCPDCGGSGVIVQGIGGA